MKPTEMKIGDLLYQRQPFMIPRYQRSYAWDDEQISDFSSDLVDLTRRRLKGSPRSHFFGGIVSIMEIVAGTGAGREYHVIDGQQRLATFMLTMRLLVEAYEALATKLDEPVLKNTAINSAALLRSEYIEYTDIKDGQRITLLRLVLSRADADFFEAVMRGQKAQPTRESHNRLASAKRKLKRYIFDHLLKDRSPEESLTLLETLALALREDCQVIHLVSDSREEAYRLFQVLNDRGIGLTEGDLLRSQILEMLEQFPPQQTRAEKAWDVILAAEFEETEQFLRTYYASKKGERAGRRTLLDEFRRGFFPQNPQDTVSADALANGADEMANEFRIFRRLADKEWPYDVIDAKVTPWDQNRLKLLVDVLSHRLAMPMLLSAAALLDQRTFADIVHLTERFVFRYVNISKQHVGTLNELYYQHSVKIRENPAAYRVSQLESDFAQLLAGATDELFVTLLPQRLSYKGSTKVLKYFLLTTEQFMPWIEDGASGAPRCYDKAAVYFDASQLEIEHIYPQNPEIPDESLEPHKHRLGNLTFWGPTDNKAASNLAYEKKREFYANSNVRLNREVAQRPSWTTTEIESREATLLDRARKVFSFRP